MEQARRDWYLHIEKAYADAVPASVDQAADDALQKMQGWIAAGALPHEKPLSAAGKTSVSIAKAGIGVKIAAVVLTAALLGAGTYAAVPAARDAVSALISAERAAAQPGRRDRQPADYVIPDPGEGYALREDVSTDTMIGKWFVSDRSFLMVQIAKKLPDIPADGGEAIAVGSTAGMMYDVDGDQVLVLFDGDMTVLIRTYTENRQELLDYAELFAAANGM